MKRKMHSQIQPEQIRLLRDQRARAEINSFMQAVDSYPTRIAAEPGLTFRKHFRSVLTDAENFRRRNRFPRH
jgi:hypothetical protein